MITCEQFEQAIQEALVLLYDPDYDPSEAFCTLMDCDARQGVLAVQSAIIRAIKGLEPSSNTPPSAQTRQVYDILYSRFVLKLTQEETAERLHMSVPSVKRAQRKAIHALAMHLWERGSDRSRSPDTYTQGLQALDWHSQAKRELASLESSAPEATCDVGDIISDVLELQNALVSRDGFRAEIGFIQPGLVVAFHPSVVRQMLITAIGQLIQHMPTGQITIFAGLEDGNVRVTLTSPLAPGDEPIESNLVLSNILVPEGTSVEAGSDGDRFSIWMELLSTDRTTVLVVDDNPDMARFYRRSTAGTRYRIVHVSGGQDVFEVIEAETPSVIYWT